MQQAITTYIPEGRDDLAEEFTRHLDWWSEVPNQDVVVFRTLPKIDSVVSAGVAYPDPLDYPDLFKIFAFEYLLEDLYDVALWVDPHVRLGDVWRVIGWAADENKERFVIDSGGIDLSRFCIDLRRVQNLKWIIDAKKSVTGGDPVDLQQFTNERFANSVKADPADFDGQGKSFLKF